MSRLQVNSALRIAITHGFHVHGRLKEYLQSEKTHLNRLWWTIYMQEK
jgi:proline utilization trans-activator